MAEIDWKAEARSIGEWHWYPNIKQGSIICDCNFIRVDSRGDTEQLAARDAVLRFREVAKKALPEYEELRSAAIEVRDSRYLEIEERVAALSAVLARIDAKERP